ncbi:response regulator transcription factor [Nocardia colli]|uniref:Response regulator transcription factor n=1 Tax=Nocardia colli TaxID=2545717 RepID=A0A5N0E431_9NOCA|nr:response regulator transcription factor [Nocardia colli]KAA8884187.1 response regulator transcription factor [Nocardia colli]
MNSIGSTGQDLLIVDDCRLYREGLAASVAREFADGSVRTANDSTSMARALSHRPPDVILLNLASYDSRAVMQAARRHSPDSRLIVLGVSEDDEAGIVACAEAGVRGYHLRSGSLADLLALIAGVLAGEPLCSPRVAAVLMRRVTALADQGRSERKVLALTERENQILHLLELGLSNKEIADKLCIGIPTVKNHVHSLLAKLGVRRRADAVVVARGRAHGASI